MAIRTEADIVLAFTQYLTSRLQFVDTTEGRPLSSLLFDSIALELSTAYTALAQVQVDQGISDPTQADTDAMDGLAFNWSLTRRGATASTGIVTFQSASAPTTTVQVGNSDGSGGVVVATSRQATGTVVSFTTIQTVYLTPQTTINPQTNLYEVDAPVRCQSVGALGNVDAGAISALQSSVPGIDSVVNKISTTGGHSQEDNTTLTSRIAFKSQGQQPGIANGLVTTALDQSASVGAIVVGPNDPEFVRFGVPGAVDLTVLGSQITSSVQTVTYTTNQPFVLLSNRPATAVTAVNATVGLTSTSLTAGVDYVFSQDLASTTALSSQSNDQLSWLNGQHPNIGSQYSIEYQYDAAIPAIQALLSADAGHFITANPLAKRATQVLINMSLSVRQVSGFTPATVALNVAGAISNLVNNLGLGDPVQQSDLVLAIKSAVGVSSVVLPFSQLFIRGQSPTVADIVVNKYQYARVDAASIAVTVI